MRTETVTIVFTDIKGYTEQTARQTHRQNADLLKRVERLVEPVVRAFGGRVVKSIGDAYMIVFGSPTEAVRCAMAVQDRLFQHNRAHEDQQIHLRVAINTGEVRVHRGDVFGEPVNVAARIESITPAEEIYLSQAVYLTMNRSDVACERLGDFELKGIAEPVVLYRVSKDPAAEEGSGRAAYGGRYLGQWQRMRMLRLVYLALWLVGLIGVGAAAYVRYRPADDHGAVVQAAQTALQRGDPNDALALIRTIPAVVRPRVLGLRRLRQQAVEHLLASDDVEMAAREIDVLLDEDANDPETLFLRADVLLRRDESGGLEALAKAVEARPALIERKGVVEHIVAGFRQAATRSLATRLVESVPRERVVEELVGALASERFDHGARRAVAASLEQLGAGDRVDWVALALVDLGSTSCQTRKAAIETLAKAGDQRALEPLTELAKSKSCGAAVAKKAIAKLTE